MALLPSGAKSYNKTKPIRIEVFDAERAWWFGEQPKKKGKARVAASPHDASFFTNRVESPQVWRVTIEQIQANGYNLDIKNPHDTSEAHVDPDELLAEYQQLMTELQQTRNRLKDELFQALNNSREGAKMKYSPGGFSPRFLATPISEQNRIMSMVTDLLEAKLTQAESASTQLLSAAVHAILGVSKL